MCLNVGDSKIINDEEVSMINSVYYLISGYFVNLKVGSVCFCFFVLESGFFSWRKNCLDNFFYYRIVLKYRNFLI